MNKNRKNFGRFFLFILGCCITQQTSIAQSYHDNDILISPQAQEQELSGKFNILLEAGSDNILVDKKSDILFVQEAPIIENKLETITNNYSMAVQTVDILRVGTFLKNGVSPHLDLYKGNTLVHISAMRASSEMLDLSLSYRANIVKPNMDGLNFLHLAISTGNKNFLESSKAKLSPEVWKQLIAQANKGERTPMHTALAQLVPNLDVIQFLHKEGIDLNKPDINKQTALHYAVANFNWESAELLLSLGADIKAKDKHDRTVEDYLLDKMPIGLAHMFFKYLSQPYQEKIVKVVDKIVVGSGEQKIYEINND